MSAAFSLGILFPATTARAAGAGDAYDQARSAYHELDQMPEEKKRLRHHWQSVIDRFKAVSEKYPKSSYADDALYMEGKLYFDLYDYSHYKADLHDAVDRWKECATKYPASNYADDALFWEAKALDLLDRRSQEIDVLRSLLEKHPKGDMVRDAKKLLAKIDPNGDTETAAATPTPEATATPEMVAKATPIPTPTPRPVATPAVTEGGTAGEPQQVHAVKVFSNDGYTRVAIYTGGEVHWKAHEIKADGDKPPRVYVDLTAARVGDDLKQEAPKLDNSWEMPIEDGLLKRARVAQYDGTTVRVVLDLTSISSWKITPFFDPFRVVFDFYGVADDGRGAVASAAGTPTPAAVATLAMPVPTPVASGTLTAAQLEKINAQTARKTGLSLTQQLGLTFTRIFIDAGHGGHDPGAIGPTGVREKDVNLAIARKLQKKLVELGYDAILTRKDDTFLELDERTGLANEGRGDLFVSIHCNSTDKKGDRNASGIETYYADIASDRGSARLAAIENATSEKHMNQLDEILKGLLHSEFTLKSADLATSVETNLVSEVRKKNPGLRMHGKGVKSALFYVCLTANMPAILVETSFISNPKEEKRLADPKYQQLVADGIADAVDAWVDAQVKFRPLRAQQSPVEPPPKTTTAKKHRASKKHR